MKRFELQIPPRHGKTAFERDLVTRLAEQTGFTVLVLDSKTATAQYERLRAREIAEAAWRYYVADVTGEK